MLPHLTTFSRTFQTREKTFSLINPVIERALFNIKEVDDKRTPLESLKNDLSGRLSLLQYIINKTCNKWRLCKYLGSMLDTGEDIK